MTNKEPYVERPFQPLSGWLMVAVWFGLLALMIWMLIDGSELGEPPPREIIGAVLTVLTLILLLPGFFIVNPNVSRVLVLFGHYRGTVRQEGFHWTNPFTIKKKVSLRAHNLASKTIKVNDLLGNPIEIGAVVVWRVRDTAQAIFDVEKYEEYVDVQTEAAIRNLAQHHPYDDALTDTDVPTLRGDIETVGAKLTAELQNRFERAGIEAVEARLSHLAYASEIASAMLQRQQAAAVIAARRLIVDGAVGIVEHALADLGSKRVVELDDERRATLVGNLLVVLCGHSSPMPVLNAGSLYN